MSTYRRKKKRPAPPSRAYTEADRVADEAMRSPDAIAAAIRSHYRPQCHPALRAYVDAPAYGLLFADAHSSIHPDLIGPVMTRAEAIEAQAASRAQGVDCVVMAGVTVNCRLALAAEGFVISDADLMAPGTRIFIDRYGRTPKAILRAHRTEGHPLAWELPPASMASF